MCLETGCIYKSIHEASKITGIHRPSIGKCCNNIVKTAGDFHWIFYNNDVMSEEDRIKMVENIGSGNGKRVICIETGKVYDSIRDAAKKERLDNSSLARTAKGNQKTCGGLHWKYA